MPVIMLCCAVGSFAIGNNLFGVITVATFGIIGYMMEENGYPVAAMVLGIVMGTMVEQAFVTSLIKSDGSILPFFERPISAILAGLHDRGLRVAAVGGGSGGSWESTRRPVRRLERPR